MRVGARGGSGRVQEEEGGEEQEEEEASAGSAGVASLERWVTRAFGIEMYLHRDGGRRGAIDEGGEGGDGGRRGAVDEGGKGGEEC